MKRQLALLALLAVASARVSAGSEVFHPIPCGREEGNSMVDALIAAEGGAYKESLRAVLSRLKTGLDRVLYDKDGALTRTDPADVKALLKQAACIREVGTGMQASDAFMEKYAAHTKEIERTSGFNFLKMPGDPKTVEQDNMVNNARLLYYNRDAFAFVRTLLE